MRNLLICLILVIPQFVLAEPPWSGTIFIDPDIITDADPTTFVESMSKGTG